MYFDSPFADTLSDVEMTTFSARRVAITQSRGCRLGVDSNGNTARYDDAATRPTRMVQLLCLRRGYLSTELLFPPGMFIVFLNIFQSVNIYRKQRRRMTRRLCRAARDIFRTIQYCVSGSLLTESAPSEPIA
jgi:hypothetical protein